jgi:hypothetical protein
VLSINMIANWFAIGLTLRLDDKDDVDPKWTFHIGAALTTAASAVIEIISSATKPAIVKWNVTGAITLHVDSVAIGNMDANSRCKQ